MNSTEPPRSGEDRLLDVNEAGALLRLRPRTVYKLAYEGRLPVVKVGRAIRFRLLSLLALMESLERPAVFPLTETGRRGSC